MTSKLANNRKAKKKKKTEPKQNQKQIKAKLAAESADI